MPLSVRHPAENRGHASHGWLDAHHSFSFANFFDPELMGFWALRVLNDDSVSPGKGFGTHPHVNMEIVTIPLEGALEHRDSLGHSSVIRKGEIQVMSAGTGVRHSERNASGETDVKLLQIWVIPNEAGVAPRYAQSKPRYEKNVFVPVVTPKGAGGEIWIHQDAWFHIGRFEAGTKPRYAMKDPKNGAYVFVIEGEIEAEGARLSRRDAAGFEGGTEIGFEILTDSEILVIEVPMADFDA